MAQAMGLPAERYDVRDMLACNATKVRHLFFYFLAIQKTYIVIV